MTNDEAMYYLGIIYERSKNGKRPYHTIYQDAFDMAIEALRTQDLPSAQPIRCKDCRWRDDYGHWLGCPVLNTDDDNFCSYAERRTDD